MEKEMVKKIVLEKTPTVILKVIKILVENGYESYLVGGAVRDILMDKIPKDYDICTSATTEDIKRIFPKHFGLGEKFGTVSIIMDEEVIEITTFRKDSEYSDGRHPDSVEFTKDIVEDLSRRDLTMNAIALSPFTGIVDPFNGFDDINNKIIRAVGSAKNRFDEDGLRIVRAIRFSSCLGFSIEEETQKAMIDCKNNLKNVSKERFSSELIRILKGKNVFNAIKTNAVIFSIVIPEFDLVSKCPQQNPYHIYDVLDHTLKVVEAVPCDDVLKISAFFHDFGKAYVRFRDKKGIDRFGGHAAKSEELTISIMKNLKFDSKTVKDVALLVKYHDALWEPRESAVKRLIGEIGFELFDKLLLLRVADINAQAPREDNSVAIASAIRDKIVAEGAAVKASELKINGFDIMNLLNIKPSPIIGQIIKDLLNLVIEDKCKNEKEALEFRARGIYNKKMKQQQKK